MKPCITISNKNKEETIAIMKRYELAEIRLDLCSFLDQDIEAVFQTETTTIATCRVGKYSEIECLRLLKIAIDYKADYIDIGQEYSEQNRADLISYTQSKNTKIILSYHNFDNAASLEFYQKTIQDYTTSGADIVKIAVKVVNKEEALTLMNLYQNEDNIIAFGMGDWASFTRIASYYLGAPWVYVYEGDDSNKLAAGQLGSELVKYLN